MKIKKEDMTAKERVRLDLDLKRRGTISRANGLVIEIKKERVAALKKDPSNAAYYAAIDALEERRREIELEKRKLHFDALSPEEKRIRTLIGWNPYESELKVCYRLFEFTDKESRGEI